MHVRTYQIFARDIKQENGKKAEKRQIMQSMREFAGRNFCIPNCSISHCKRSWREAGKRITLFLHSWRKRQLVLITYVIRLSHLGKSEIRHLKHVSDITQLWLWFFKARVDPSSTVLSPHKFMYLPFWNNSYLRGKRHFFVILAHNLTLSQGIRPIFHCVLRGFPTNIPLIRFAFSLHWKAMKNFLTAVFEQSHMVNEIFPFPNEIVAFDFFEGHKRKEAGFTMSNIYCVFHLTIVLYIRYGKLYSQTADVILFH